jgi:hypothetical protein
MKQGKTLTELAAELEDQERRKMDFITDTRKLSVNLQDEGPAQLVVPDVGRFAISNTAQSQMCSRLKVPAKFYNLMEGGTMRERDALQEVMNARLQEHPSNRMVRTFKDDDRGTARAFLSDRYRRIDNTELLLKAAMPALQSQGNMKIASCEVTDSRMYLKVVFPDMQGEPIVGDVVRSGIIISNSETGLGSLKVERMVERLVCLNGMIVGSAMRRFHIGKSQDEGLMDILSDEALEADDTALWLKVRDAIAAAADPVVFADTIGRLSMSAELRVPNPPAAIKMLAKRFGFNEDEEQGVLTALINGDEVLNRLAVKQTQYGLIQAVTAFSQQIDDYERATDFEAFGGQILDLAPSEWKTIVKAKEAA